MNDARWFERVRPSLHGRAYRMLGDLAEADDVVQEAWLRWTKADRSSIANREAWLTTVVSRLALDRLRCRRREQRRYVGPWLPTPIVDRSPEPDQAAAIADSLTTAFLIMLERLTPAERAAFLMADVFGDPYDEIAAALGRTPASCRQLASRARRKVRGDAGQRRDRSPTSIAVAERFVAAIAGGDLAAAVDCLAPDAVYISDGGRHVRAARRPVVQPDRIARLLCNLSRRWPRTWSVAPAVVGGFPGLIVERRAGGATRLVSVTSIEVVDGKVARITSVLNPAKLDGVGRAAGGMA